MQDRSEGIMIALLPITSDWCQIKLPHMTIVYAGKISERRPEEFSEMVKDTAALAAISKPMTVKVRGKDVMGDDSDRVDVLKLQITPELASMRRFVEKWNRSQYAEFKPHCTIGMAGESVPPYPTYLSFNRLCLQWGEEMVNFNLQHRSM